MPASLQPCPLTHDFHSSLLRYNGDYDTERTLIVTGTATLTPSDGSDPITIEAGDSVWFHKGFACEWDVHEPMTKRCTATNTFPLPPSQSHSPTNPRV